MQATAIKVGDLAKQTGVSVRTLHYYDEIGLLAPSQRLENGYRLYVKDDIIRLQQIVSLRQIGFSLEQIRQCLDRDRFSPHHVVQLHLSRLQQQMELQQKLSARLEAIAAHLRSAQTVSLEEFLQLIEATMTIEKYYTPQQINYLKERAQTIGPERIERVQSEWQELIEQARTAMQNGIDPSSEAVQALARRGQALIQEFTGGDPGIERSLNQMYQQEGAEVASRGAIDSSVMEYMGRAMAAGNGMS
ncbi:MAG: MerR family transcriptional regulator [Cyanosarcina radialis HA8281-LM2]|jgi:DNA-binding transcriptional MerR regulator|nr:MerR family transcriptional regulator [Cyanosarcina radialis HA8281-LM2]